MGQHRSDKGGPATATSQDVRSGAAVLPSPAAGSTGYFASSQRPLQSLLFLLPLILIYEVGLLAYGTDQIGIERDIYARRLLHAFFGWFGVGVYYLPGLLVVVTLVILHLVQRDRWRIEPRLYAIMAVECLVLAVPLFVFGLVASVTGPTTASLTVQASGPSAESWMADVVFGLGAGIYEELVFRMLALALLHALFADVLGLPDHWAATVSIGLSAIGFACYHFNEATPIAWGRFVFYVLAGAYFAVLYLTRGFGVVAGTHAFYNFLVVTFGLLGRWR